MEGALPLLVPYLDYSSCGPLQPCRITESPSRDPQSKTDNKSSLPRSSALPGWGTEPALKSLQHQNSSSSVPLLQPEPQSCQGLWDSAAHRELPMDTALLTRAPISSFAIMKPKSPERAGIHRHISQFHVEFTPLTHLHLNVYMVN